MNPIIPRLPAMSLHAAAALDTAVHTFTAHRSTHEESHGLLVVADRPEPQVMRVEMVEGAEERAVEALKAAMLLRHIARPTELLWFSDAYESRAAMRVEGLRPADDPEGNETLMVLYGTGHEVWATSIGYDWTETGMRWRKPYDWWECRDMLAAAVRCGVDPTLPVETFVMGTHPIPLARLDAKAWHV